MMRSGFVVVIAALCGALACTKEGPGGAAASPEPAGKGAQTPLTIAMMPKNKIGTGHRKTPKERAEERKKKKKKR